MSAWTENQSNHLVRPVCVSVTVIVAIWGISGWIIETVRDNARSVEECALMVVLTLALSFVTINASAQHRRAISPDRKRFWMGALILGAAWTAVSAHHAYDVIAQPPPITWTVGGLMSAAQSSMALIILTALCFYEPFFMGEIEETEREARQALADQQREQETARQQREREEQARSERDRIRALAAAGVPTIGALTSTAHALPVSAHATTPETLTERGAQVSCYRGHADARAHALALKAEGMTAAECARAIGKPLSTVSRWFREADKRAG